MGLTKRLRQGSKPYVLGFLTKLVPRYYNYRCFLRVTVCACRCEKHPVQTKTVEEIADYFIGVFP